MNHKTPTKRWLEKADLYMRFASDTGNYTYTPTDAMEMFTFESTGKGSVGELNGFALCKKRLDITLAMWKEDIVNGLLTKYELIQDGYPESWISRVLAGVYVKRTGENKHLWKWRGLKV